MAADPGRPACGPWDRPRAHTHLRPPAQPLCSQTVVLSSHPVAPVWAPLFEKAFPVIGAALTSLSSGKVLASCSTLRGMPGVPAGFFPGLGGEDGARLPDPLGFGQH